MYINICHFLFLSFEVRFLDRCTHLEHYIDGD